MADKLSRTLRTSAALRELERERRLVREALSGIEAARAAQAHLRAPWVYSREISAILNTQYHLRTLGGPIADLNRMLDEQRGVIALPPSVISDTLRGMTRLAKDRQRWEEITRGLLGTRWSDLYAVSAQRWTTAVAHLTEGLQQSGIAERNPLLAERLFAPYEAYTRFAQASLESLQRATKPHQALLSAALTFGATEITASAAIIEHTLDEEWSDESALLIDPPRPNAFRQLRTEVRLIEVRGDATPAELVMLSGTADLMASGRRFAALVPECNTIAEVGGLEQIFSYTSTLVESLQALPFSVATDRDSLARVVDALYFVLYEGAGSTSLRYLAEGLLTREECTVVWRLKHLRNKWLRHDPERGDPGDVRRNRTALREALSGLGLHTTPRRRDDYVLLHRSLMNGAIDMLELLSDRLASTSS